MDTAVVRGIGAVTGSGRYRCNHKRWYVCCQTIVGRNIVRGVGTSVVSEGSSADRGGVGLQCCLKGGLCWVYIHKV